MGTYIYVICVFSIDILVFYTGSRKSRQRRVGIRAKWNIPIILHRYLYNIYIYTHTHTYAHLTNIYSRTLVRAWTV